MLVVVGVFFVVFFFLQCDKAHKRLMSPAGWRRRLSLLSSSDGPLTVSLPVCLSVCLCFSWWLHTQSSRILPLWWVPLAKRLRNRQSQDHLRLRPPRKMWVPATNSSCLHVQQRCSVTPLLHYLTLPNTGDSGDAAHVKHLVASINQHFHFVLLFAIASFISSAQPKPTDALTLDCFFFFFSEGILMAAHEFCFHMRS